VKEETARLGMAPRNKLEAHNETQALAKLNSGMTYDGYKDSLVKAKEDTLPDLFQAIKDENEALANWMSAKVIPLKAQAEGLGGLVEQIDNRIFSVDLYAGLSENVEQIAEGDPADEDEKVHLMQRRCYMDEECLAQYQTGGMEFKDIRAFDAWMAQPENRDRLLPFPRCIVSFQVRRHDKERETPDIRSFVRMIEDRELDKSTFLYLRNGDRIFRMSTKLEFGEKLFPDMDRARLETGKVYAKMFGTRVDNLISENEYLGMNEDHERQVREYDERQAAYEAALKTPEAKARAKAQGKKKPDASCVDVSYPGVRPWGSDVNGYQPYTKESVYYDDITAKIQGEIRHHNRIGLILQGLLDRSPVFHPHPPWEIWTEDGFAAALELIYDESRVLVAGEKPDFEAFRQKLNESLKKGSVTIGQDDAWQRYEAEKENRRMDEDHRSRGEYRYTYYKPYGNPGPGVLARVTQLGKRSGKATFAWERERQAYDRRGEKIRSTYTCDVGRLLNADAYTPGDFHQFFDDPRTRAEYLKWAPMLLEAEEYHAGNRDIGEPPKPKPKPRSSWEGRRRYAQRKLRKELTGKAVRLTQKVVTQGEKVYEKGSLWRVTGGTGDTFSIMGINDEGKQAKNRRYVTGVRSTSFEVDESIPESDDYD